MTLVYQQNIGHHGEKRRTGGKRAFKKLEKWFLEDTLHSLSSILLCVFHSLILHSSDYSNTLQIWPPLEVCSKKIEDDSVVVTNFYSAMIFGLKMPLKSFLAQYDICSQKSYVVKIEDDSVVVTNFYRAMLSLFALYLPKFFVLFLLQ